MVRPRGKSNPMTATRLLKTSTSGSASVLNLQMAPLGVLAPALEEDLESQARASLSLFGFGVHDAVNWSLVASGDAPSNGNAMNNSNSMANGMGYSNSNSNVNGNTNGNGSGNSYTPSSSSTSANGNGASGVTLLERVCPIGTNAFLWNTMNMGESGASGMSDPTSGGDINSNGGNAMSMTGEDDPEWDPLGYGHIFASKILQQYLVKCVAVLPASVEEVVDLIIRSDRDDMETPMHHLVGVKLTASGIIYRRKRKRARRSSKQYARRINNNNSNNVSPATSSAAINSSSRRQRTGRTPPSSQPQLHQVHQLQSQLQQQIAGDESESSSSDSEDEEDVVVLDDNTENQTLNELNRPSPPSSARPHLRSTESVNSHSNHSINNERPTASGTASMSSSTSSLGSYSSYLDEYRASLTQGQQGNLSLKWVVGEKTGRMFTQKANYCLLDYECVLVNDWEDPHAPDAGRPMYVRALQSVYLPQCQPWIDELGVKPTDLQPTGIMVREATQRPGFVEVQFVASILEKAQLPMTSRRSKLRALCAKVAKLEEVITSRRLSQSLLAHTPLWVHNRERPVCHCCDAVFNLTRRRHHCRLCGEICCSDCCPKKDVALPEVGTTSVRVCVFCVQKRRHSGDALEGSTSVSSSTLSPVGRTGNGGGGGGGSGSHPSSANSSYYNMATPPPPHHHPLQHSLSSSSSSSPSDYNLSSSSYSSSFSGNGGTTGSSLGDRKPSLASSVFYKFKSNSLGN